MKHKSILLIIAFYFSSNCLLQCQTIWNGPDTTFIKADGADWTMEASQDRITPNVWLTRANSKGLFNISVENSYSDSAPQRTEWAFGTTANIAALSFKALPDLMSGAKPELNKQLVLHLIEDSIYLNFQFKTWSTSMTGGFSYVRSSATDSSTSVFKLSHSKKIVLLPNYSTSKIQIQGLDSRSSYSISSLNGSLLRKGKISNLEFIDIANLLKGKYYLKLENEVTLKFVKN